MTSDESTWVGSRAAPRVPAMHAGAGGCYVERRGPLVWVTPPAKLTDADVAGVLASLELELLGSSRYALLFDLTSTGIPTPVQRRAIAAHMRDNATRIQRCVAGLAIVLSSPLVRGVVTALFWVAPPHFPYGMFETPEEAALWAATLVQP